MNIRIRAVLFFAVVLALLPAGARGQETPSPAGHWEGAIQVPGGELGINVDLVLEEDAWSGDISIPLQQAEDLPLSDIVVEGTRVAFVMTGVAGTPSFDGTLSEDGKTIAGSFTQSGQTFDFLLSREG